MQKLPDEVDELVLRLPERVAQVPEIILEISQNILKNYHVKVPSHK